MTKEDKKRWEFFAYRMAYREFKKGNLQIKTTIQVDNMIQAHEVVEEYEKCNELMILKLNIK